MADADVYLKHMSRTGDIDRLTDQFNLITTNIGYYIHPSIASRLPPSGAARIADVATGTGIYLQQLTELYPDAILDGYDVSALQFPDKASLAQNVNLNLLDVKKPIPQELHGTYDVVHVQLLAAGMLSTDWKPVVRNIVQLLKPGGALQWTECDFSGAKLLRGRVESSISAMRQIGKLAIEAMREHVQTGGWDTLDECMANAGLVEVQRDVVSTDRIPETRAATTKNRMVTCFAWARSNKDPIPLNADELLELERKAYADVESGGYMRFDIHTVFGFKPELVASDN